MSKESSKKSKKRRAEEEEYSPKKKVKHDGSFKVLKSSQESAVINVDNTDERLNSKQNKGPSINGWPVKDIENVISRIINSLSSRDLSMKHVNGVCKINWSKIKFDSYSEEDCKKIWNFVEMNQRKYRTLAEVLNDSKKWLENPSVNYKAISQILPEIPRKPLSGYLIFFHEQKSKLQQHSPHLKFGEINKLISDKYKQLSEKKKHKYAEKAEKLKEQYSKDMAKFYNEHPDLASVMSSAEGKLKVPFEKPKKPFQLFFESKLKEKCVDDPSFDRNAYLEKCKNRWKNLSERKKLPWIVKAIESENNFKKSVENLNKESGVDYPLPAKSVISKEEQAILDASRGKPIKPPGSAYALYTSMRLTSEDMSARDPKKRFQVISKEWNSMSPAEKKIYADQNKKLLDEYNTQLIKYLETLNPEEREQEILKTKAQVPKTSKLKTEKSKMFQSTLEESFSQLLCKTPKQKVKLCMGEPEQPPENIFLFYVDEAQKKNPNISSKEIATKYAQLSSEEKEKLNKRFKKLQKDYYIAFESFLESLSPKSLKKFMQRKNQANAAIYEDENSNGGLETNAETNSKGNSADDGEDNDDNYNHVNDSDDEEKKTKEGTPKRKKTVLDKKQNRNMEDDLSSESDELGGSKGEALSQKATTVQMQVVKKLQESSDSNSDDSSNSD